MTDSLNRDVQKLARKLSSISKSAIPKADFSALKKTANQRKSKVTKDVAGEVQVQQKHIRKRLYTKVKVTKDYRRGRITAYRRDIPAISLGVATSFVKSVRGQRQISQASRDSKGRFTRREFAGNTSIKVGRRTYNDAFINPVNGKWQIMRRKTAKRYPVEVITVKIAPAVDRFLPSRSREIMKAKYPDLLKHELEWRLKKYEDKS